MIAAYADGTIVLDDGITTWEPLRACAFLATNLLADRDSWQKQAEIQAESLRVAQAEVERLNIGKGSSITGQEADALRQQLVEYQKIVINYEVDARLMFVLTDDYKKNLTEAEFWIRKRVWAGHGCDGIYGDDGEMQCNNLTRHGKPLDFKRMPMAEVFAIDTRCKLEAAANYQNITPAEGS